MTHFWVTAYRLRTSVLDPSHPYFSFLDWHVHELSSLLYLEAHVALAHVEQLLPLLQVVVLAHVGAADEEYLVKNSNDFIFF